jgi:hypothetical protein
MHDKKSQSVLQEIIRKAYEIFSKYPVTRPLDVCTDECCMKVEDEARLASLPVRQIPLELLTQYNDSAKPEKTQIEEIKHFLPRYLELIAAFNFPTHSAELSFSRLTPFDKSEWTEPELEILENFSTEFFTHALSTYPIPSFNDKIDSILIMLWRGNFNVEKLLTVWEHASSLQSLLHFNDLYFYGFSQQKRSKLSNSFGDKELAHLLVNWLENERTHKIFKEQIERTVPGNLKLSGQTMNELNLLYEILSIQKRGGGG